MEDEVITIRDLLSELSLSEKLWLLGKIYWRKVTDSRLVRFVCIFSKGAYGAIFKSKSPSRLMCDSFTERDFQMSNANPGIGLSTPKQLPVDKDVYVWGEAKPIIPGLYTFGGERQATREEVREWFDSGKPVKFTDATKDITVVAYCSKCNKSFGTSGPLKCATCGELAQVDYLLDADGFAKRPATPADYQMTSTTLYDSKNFEEERMYWDQEIMSLYGERVPADIVSQWELDFWFKEDYKPSAVVQILVERTRNKKQKYFVQLSPGEFWREQ